MKNKILQNRAVKARSTAYHIDHSFIGGTINALMMEIEQLERENEQLREEVQSIGKDMFDIGDKLKDLQADFAGL